MVGPVTFAARAEIVETVVPSHRLSDMSGGFKGEGAAGKQEMSPWAMN
jgi:hypothetical protein